MALKVLYVNLLLVLALGLNFYKIALMFNSPYYIFPWSNDGVEAKSSGLLLIIHTILALGLVSRTRKWILAENPVDRANAKSVTETAFFLFVLSLLPMMWNLGSAPSAIAVLINSVVLCCLGFFLGRDYQLTFYTVLNLPVILEAVKIITTLLA